MPLIEVKTAQQAMDERAERHAEREAEANHITSLAMADNSQLDSQLLQRVMKDWHAAQNNKTTVEVNALECLRERKGVYDPAKLAEIHEVGGSDLYIKLATTKIRAGIAHIKSILLPHGEHAHGLKPTRIPDLPPWMRDKAIEYILSRPEFVDPNTGQPVPLGDQAEAIEHLTRQALFERAKESARRMENLIYDQMQEAKFRGAASDMVEDFCTYPAAFMKGPYTVMGGILQWELQPDGSHKPVTREAPKMAFRTINFFDAYPSPGVDSVHKASFTERLRLHPDELYAMRDLDGYNKKRIDKLLSKRREQGVKLSSWLWTDSVRNMIADHDYFWYKSETEFDGIHWKGKAQGWELLEHGVSKAELGGDLLRTREIDVTVVDGVIIKVALNTDPNFKRNVHSSCYEKIPGSVYGNSVSMLMRHSLSAVQGCGRSLMNNLAHSSGFQVEIDKTRLSEETDAYDIHPFKVWEGKESEHSGDRPTVRFFQPTSNAETLIGVMDHFTKMADNDTGIPEFFHGGAGGGEGADATARGRAMLMDQSAKLLRSSINNLDEDIFQPILESMYVHNMLYHPDDSVKGDVQVVAKGPNAMLAREGTRQQHMALLEVVSNNPVANQLVGLEGQATIVKGLADTFEELQSDEIIPAGEALNKRIDEIKNAPPPPDPAMLKVENDKLRLEMDGQKMQMENTLAREKMVADIQAKQQDQQVRLQTSRDDLDKKVAEDRIRLLAEKESAKEEAKMAYEHEKLKAEFAARQKVAEMKMQIKMAREDRNSNEKLAANQPAEPTEPSVTPEQIQAAVQAAVMPMFSSLREETFNIVANLTREITGEESNKGNIHVSVNMPDCKPTTKKVTSTRDAQGNLQATITPEHN